MTNVAIVDGALRFAWGKTPFEFERDGATLYGVCTSAGGNQFTATMKQVE